MPDLSVSRRDVFRAAATVGATVGASWFGHAQPIGANALRPDNGAEFITADTQSAIDRGLSHLAQGQGADGAFTDRAGGTASGITGLGGLALMGAGHQPGRGKYGKNVSAALDYMLKLGTGAGARAGFLSANEGGFGGRTGPSAMYSHGFASLFLAEVCGMTPDPARQKKVRAALEQSTAFSVAAQNKEGGWRYEPGAAFADVSVTVAYMMALRAARNAGVFVRKSVVRNGAEYIRGCQAADGGFTYFKGQGFSAFARTAAAIVGLYSASVPEDDEVNGKAIDRGLRYLQQFTPGRQFNQREIPAQHYYYGQYYAALAMWTAGGDYWRTWFPAVRDDLLARARANGGVWSDQYHGSAYATAMSLIVLQLPNNYLPILQK
ncbi:MAG: terpene cyclase/mutase family protein [Planctomycetes bacterium]|nr:terpene cyclase/mutase family protein [Planctomycetota bacterium]